MFGFGKPEPFGRLSVDEVETLVARGEASVFDNNGAERWKLGHVPTAKPLDSGHVEPQDLPPDPARTLVFYCAGPL